MKAGTGAVVALAVVAVLALQACGGGDSSPLTAEEYADALLKARAGIEERGETSADKLAEEFDLELVKLAPRLARLDLKSDEPWSEEDAEAASDFAELFLDILTRSAEAGLASFEDYHDDLTDMQPPEALSDLHDRLVAAMAANLEELEGYIQGLKELDTTITTREEYEAFGAGFESLADALDIEVGEEFEAACRELREGLARETGKAPNICG